MNAKQEKELAEANGHLLYWQRLEQSLGVMISRAKGEIILAQKEQKRWEGRIATMERKA
ncbi:hypothetical protein M0R72_17780 [Candidatus Pacearchaeota archaeon]|jgi:hypothetical protein|nr:hypothetical protein [Candidatus Pacearchaeota archaeon]